MSLTRSIDILVYTDKENLVSLIQRFIDGLYTIWDVRQIINSYSRIDYGIDSFNTAEEFYKMIDARHKNNERIAFEMFDFRYNESIIWSIEKREDYRNFKGYKFSFLLGNAERIENAEPFTDFSFYLKQIIPRLNEIGCSISQINCQDVV